MEMKISQVKGICNLKNDRNAIEGPHLPPSVLHKGVTSFLKSHSNIYKPLHFGEKFLSYKVFQRAVLEFVPLCNEWQIKIEYVVLGAHGQICLLWTSLR